MKIIIMVPRISLKDIFKEIGKKRAILEEKEAIKKPWLSLDAKEAEKGH